MAKESPLSELHRSNGAQFVEEDGWIFPAHFGKPIEEYQAVRTRLGLLDLCHRSLLRLTGPDRFSYLQGMVSNDVKCLAPGEGTYATLLDLHGKILADTRIFCLEDCFLLDLWEPLREKILTHLNRHLIADDCEIVDLIDRYGMVSLQGPQSRRGLAELLGTERAPSKELNHAEHRLPGGMCRLIRATHTGEEGFDVIIAREDLLSVVALLQERAQKLSFRWVGSIAQELLRIEAGIPRYGVDMNGEHLLLETGLDHAVSFEKGCYLGQEVIERIHSRGHVNRKLVGIVLEGETAAQRGDPIHSGQVRVGQVTSSIVSPALGRAVALGYIQSGHTDPGTPVTVHGSAHPIQGKVSRLPFYKAPKEPNAR